MSIVLDGTANTVTPLNGALGATTPSTVVATSVNTPNTFGFKNRIINGAMVIDQRYAGASVTPTTGSFTVDRWKAGLTQASKFTVQQNAGSVTPPVGFTNYLGITSSSAYSVTSTDIFLIQQPIEGYNVSDLAFGTVNASSVTLSFLVRSSLTGTFGGALTNSANNRSYPFTYTISAANTWTNISVTIAGDTSGTWLTNNGVGLSVRFGLGGGSTYSGTAGAWVAGDLYTATGATSVVGTNGATFYITGVQLEKGSTATSFDVRDYGREFQLCQRYYNKFFVGFDFYAASGYQGNAFSFAVEMRAKPTLATVGTADQSNVNLTYFPADSTLLNSSGFCAQVGLQTGNVRTYYFNTLSASAEL